MKLGIKSYSNQYYPYISFYVTLNGRQILGPYFSNNEASRMIEVLKNGE